MEIDWTVVAFEVLQVFKREAREHRVAYCNLRIDGDVAWRIKFLAAHAISSALASASS